MKSGRTKSLDSGTREPNKRNLCLHPSHGLLCQLIPYTVLFPSLLSHRSTCLNPTSLSSHPVSTRAHPSGIHCHGVLVWPHWPGPHLPVSIDVSNTSPSFNSQLGLKYLVPTHFSLLNLARTDVSHCSHTQLKSIQPSRSFSILYI
jgi:hypothetical protein